MPINKFQDVSFKNIDEFLEYIPKEELELVNYLRKIVFLCAPHCTEKLSYNVPFYKMNKNFCFIWPASVKWGKQVAYKGVRFGFTNGYLLTDETNYLDKGDRKQVYWKDFKTKKEIDTNLLKSYIYEALIIDEQYKKLHKK